MTTLAESIPTAVRRRSFTVWYKDLGRWDIGYFSTLSWAWPPEIMQPLGSVLTRVVREVKTSDLRSVPIIEKITFGGVASVLPVDDRDGYKGRLFWAEPGQFVYSRIRAKQGSFTVIDPVVGRLAVSQEYPVYDIDRGRIDPEFLKIALRSEAFLRLMVGLSHGGSTKTRMLPDQFESLKVPVPPLSVQRRIVAAAAKTRNQAARLQTEADLLESNAKREFLELLGLPIPKIGAGSPRHFVVQFRDIERWGVRHLWQSSNRLDPVGTRYEGSRLGDVIEDLENGWSPKCFDTPATGEEWGVLKVGAVSFGVFNPQENKALPPKLKPRPQLEVKAGDFLIGRANVTRLVGACALVRETRPKLMLCDKIFRAVWREPSPVIPDFLEEVLKTPHVRQQIEAALTGTSATMKNITKGNLLALRFPLPPIAVQRRIVASLSLARRDARQMRAKAAALLTQTSGSVEQMILGALQP
ncbi:MAG: restriction endonuclease subunit S [Leptolyngbya sp. PLA1]|nr:restriction endonuclease subunit S [Leptolyngbya sp. PLA1]